MFLSGRESDGSTSSTLVIGGIVVGALFAIGGMVAVIAFALMARSPDSGTFVLALDAGVPAVPAVTATPTKVAPASATTSARPASTLRALGAAKPAAVATGLADAGIDASRVASPDAAAATTAAATLAPIAPPVVNDK